MNPVQEFKKDLIAHLRNQALSCRTAASIASRRYTIDNCNAKADAYQNIILYLESLDD